MSSSSDGSAAGPKISASTTSTSTVTTVSALTSTPSTISAETQATTTTIPTPSSVSPVVTNVSPWKCVNCQGELPMGVAMAAKLRYCPFCRYDQYLGAQVVSPVVANVSLWKCVSVSAPEPVVVATTSATVQPASSIRGPVQNISMSSSTKTCTVVAISGPSTIPKIVSTPASDTAQTVATGTASLPPSGATPPSENKPAPVSSDTPLTTFAPVSTQVPKTTLTSDSSVGPLSNTTTASVSTTTSSSAIQTSVTTTPRAATITVPSSSQASQVGNGDGMVFGNMNKKQKLDDNNDNALSSDLRGDNNTTAETSTRKRSRSDEEPLKLARLKLSDSRESLGEKDFDMSYSGKERRDAGGSTKKDRKGDTSRDAGGSTKKDRNGDASRDASGSTRKNRNGDASGDSSGSSKLLKQVITFFARKKVLEEYKIYMYIDICIIYNM